ncbi:Cof-type HAD-IIB family hydrolase [[Mycoplasma] testudinis]|uniref:Cof-type HAD-IIB family hydrolase n=1 Tax=[Mycoplasma] testudinis TaxID=33924 RepID=UPI000483C591|nr:Cof-type HAD-IIB family hydrolase [[Mycoplasma] testudinis]
MDINKNEIIKEVKYLIFDMDGTLLDDHSSLHEENKKIPKLTKKYNLKHTIVSGRPLFMMHEQIEIIKPQMPVIGLNGSVIQDGKKTLWSKSLDNDLAKQLIADLKKMNMSFYAYTQSQMFVHPLHFEHVDRRRKQMATIDLKYQWKIDELAVHEKQWKEPISKFLVCTDQVLKLKELIESRYQDSLYFTQSFATVCDIGHKSVNKGEGIKELIKAYNAKPNEFMIFGDGWNDISMFNEVKYSVAMSNAHDSVKKHASFVTFKDNNNGGVADFIEKIWGSL